MAKTSNFYVNGEAADHEWILANQEMVEREVWIEMRRKGFIPAVDIPSTVSWDYDHKRGVCKYKMVDKGIKVGRKRSLEKPDSGYISKEGIVIFNHNSKAEVFA